MTETCQPRAQMADTRLSKNVFDKSVWSRMAVPVDWEVSSSLPQYNPTSPSHIPRARGQGEPSCGCHSTYTCPEPFA